VAISAKVAPPTKSRDARRPSRSEHFLEKPDKIPPLGRLLEKVGRTLLLRALNFPRTERDRPDVPSEEPSR